ncbi:MAG: TonB family protein [Pyrinomonadaceae bacterium]
MPVNVRRFCTSVLLACTAFGVAANSQSQPETNTPVASQTADTQPHTVPIKAPTSAEIMRDRISKAKAFIAVRNYSAAVYELENIRRETSDQSVQAGTAVLLMHSYLEKGDHKHAQGLATQAFNSLKANKQGSADIYNALAGQVIKVARNKVERYRSLGLMVADRNLPLEAVTDIEHMRETVELIVTQVKELGSDPNRTNMAMAMLEEAAASRSALARDEYDARRWKDEVADSRESLASSRSVITNAVDGTTSPNLSVTQTAAVPGQALTPPETTTGEEKAAAPVQLVAMNGPAKTSDRTEAARPQTEVTRPPALSADVPAQPRQPGREPNTSTGTSEPVQNRPSNENAGSGSKAQLDDSTTAVKEPKPIVVKNTTNARVEPPKPAALDNETASTGPIEVGSLIDFATRRSRPVYPAIAKRMKTTGVVRVEVIVDESGEVLDIQDATGPSLLQAAARDAVRKWQFKPFIRDGQPVKAAGYISFNFSL